MFLTSNGSFIRDIDIYELRVSYGDQHGKLIVLTRDKIAFRNTVHPTLGYMSFPQGYFDFKEVLITYEQFKVLSDSVHDAGLLELPWTLNDDMSPGANYQTLNCIFDDGARYIYRTSGFPCKEFNEIVQILEKQCGFSQNEPIICHKSENVSQYEFVPQKTKERKCYKTECCGAIILSEWTFCPKCGKTVNPSSKKKTNESLDLEETLGSCRECGEWMPMSCNYCVKCGTRR